MTSLTPRSCNSNKWPSSFRVLSAITTVSGSASACRRAARFGVLPDDRLLLSRTRADQVADYHQTGCNAHTGLKLIGGLNEPTAAITSKPRPYRSLGVVLVRPWIAVSAGAIIPH